jgi:hypothetical protein
MKDFLKKYGIPKDMAEITKGAYGNSDFCNYFMIC